MIFILLIIAMSLLCGAQAQDGLDLEFKRGDILKCNIAGMFAQHVLLATSSSTVAHLNGDKSAGTGYLLEESWGSYRRREGSTHTSCRVNGKATWPAVAVDKARQDISMNSGKSLYYHLLTCNCEHWVNKWAFGFPHSDQSFHLFASSSCDVNKNPVTESDYSRNGAGARTTNGWRCETECTRRSNGKYYCDRTISMGGGNYNTRDHCSPRRGVTYKGENCYRSCTKYLDYYYCYTDSSNNWDYCGPSSNE